MKTWLRRVMDWVDCHVFGWHSWTCAAAEGIAVTPHQLRSGVAGFHDYARMYCRRCGKESKLSREARERFPLPNEKGEYGE